MRRPTALRKLVGLGLAMTLGLGFLPAGSVGAAEFRAKECWRNDEGELIKCVSVKKTDGVRRLRVWIDGSWWIGAVRVCVRKVDPVVRRRNCNTYPLTEIRPGFVGSTVIWRDDYPFKGPGVYRVGWRDWTGGKDGGPIGALRFRVRG